MDAKHSTQSRMPVTGSRHWRFCWWQHLDCSSSWKHQLSGTSSAMSTNSRAWIRFTSFGGSSRGCCTFGLLALALDVDGVSVVDDGDIITDAGAENVGTVCIEWLNDICPTYVDTLGSPDLLHPWL